MNMILQNNRYLIFPSRAVVCAPLRGVRLRGTDVCLLALEAFESKSLDTHTFSSRRRLQFTNSAWNTPIAKLKGDPIDTPSSSRYVAVRIS
jgi:hypothetical protein